MAVLHLQTVYMLILLLLSMVSVSAQDVDCKCFSSSTGAGAYVPIDVCAAYKLLDSDSGAVFEGSYRYECLSGNVVARYWLDSGLCDGESEYYSDAYHTQHKQCDGPICSHVTLRAFEQVAPCQNTCPKLVVGHPNTC